ncbi:hypothetical protein VTN02DRAFT_4733 [Thermoascus thermophilus]
MQKRLESLSFSSHRIRGLPRESRERQIDGYTRLYTRLETSCRRSRGARVSFFFLEFHTLPPSPPLPLRCCGFPPGSLCEAARPAPAGAVSRSPVLALRHRLGPPPPGTPFLSHHKPVALAGPKQSLLQRIPKPIAIAIAIAFTITISISISISIPPLPSLLLQPTLSLSLSPVPRFDCGPAREMPPSFSSCGLGLTDEN